MADAKTAPNAQKPQGNSLGGLFGQQKPTGPSPEEIGQLRHDINSLSRRLRELEERNQNLRRKVQMTDQSMINQNRKYRQELNIVNSDMNELKHMMSELDNKMLLLIKELRMCARQEDLKVVEKYVQFWEPIKFVTRKEIERMMGSAFDDAFAKLIGDKVESIIEQKMESFK